MMKVVSFNIRYDYHAEEEINKWSQRKDELFNSVLTENPDLAGFQEVLPHLKNDFEKRLPGFVYGVPRDNGIDEGELNLIYVNESVFEVLEHDTFWLTNTPNIPSKHPSSGCLRIATWAKVKHRDTKETFYFVNTHLDNASEEARLEQVSVLNSFLKDKSFILVGDFNATDKDLEIQTMQKNAMDVAHQLNSAKGTFNGFDLDLKEEDMDRIDYIFTSNDFDAKEYKTHNTKRENGLYISDHFMISASLNIK